MRVLAWRPRQPQQIQPEGALPSGRVPGSYAGRARFRPRHTDQLPPHLQRAVGRTVEVGFAGVAPPGDRFAGQSLYLEWLKDEVLDGFLIPEEDLQFIPGGIEQPAASLWDKLSRD